MKLLGTTVNIHQQQIVQQQVLNEVILIKSFFISYQQILDLESNHFADHIDIFTGTAGYENILQLLFVIDLYTGIPGSPENQPVMLRIPPQA